MSFEKEDIQTFLGFNPKIIFPDLIAVHLIKKQGKLYIQCDVPNYYKTHRPNKKALSRRNFYDVNVNPFDYSIRSYLFTLVLPLDEKDI